MDIKTAMNCLWAEVARYNEDSRVREAWQTLYTAVSELTDTQHRQPAISALADKWCDETNQPTSVCAALYQFTTWAQKQQAGA